MPANLSSFLYLISAVCFIMALRGLSSAATSRSGNLYGIFGMSIAILTTLLAPNISRHGLILVGILAGGAIGAIIARKIRMTALPQLVAGFHSLVGLAAVLVAGAALNAPDAYGIGAIGSIKGSSLIEMGLGAAIGAVTFTGSLIAFGKLQGLLSGKPLSFSGQHLLNATLGGAIAFLLIIFLLTESHFIFWLLTLVALTLGFLLILPIGVRICPWLFPCSTLIQDGQPPVSDLP